jgi:hypothetical protein
MIHLNHPIGEYLVARLTGDSIARQSQTLLAVAEAFDSYVSGNLLLILLQGILPPMH